MSTNLNNKNRLYEFEKLAIIVVVVLAIVITILVCIGTAGNDSRESDEGNNSLVIEGTTESGGSGSSNSDSAFDSTGEQLDDESTNDSQTKVDDIEFETITVNNSSLNQGDLLLVNQDYKYTDNIDDLLVNVYTEKTNKNQSFVLSTTELFLKQQTIDALCKMIDAFYKDTKISPRTLMVSKTYISVDDQQKKYEADASKVDSSELPYLQAGGESEHHTGLAFHLVVYPSSQGVMGEGSYEWFLDNCWKFGFVLRYPEGKEDLTQFKPDASHFRYVGVPHAAYMHVNQWVLEEYITYLQDRTSCDKRAQIKDSEGVGYEIYAVKAESGDTTVISVPTSGSGWSYSVVGTNNGYFVVVLSKN